MLLRHEVTQASDVELLTVILGRRQTAETLLKQAGSLFALLFETRHDNGKLFCAQGSSAYAADAVLNGIVIGKQKHPAAPRPGQYVNPDFTFSDVFKLAEESGGEAMEGGKIGDAFEHMIERIRARYSLQYDAPQTAPGVLHRIQVQLTPETRAHHMNAVIRARAGYYGVQ